MPTFNPAAAQVVADAWRTRLKSLDTTLQETTCLMAAFIEAVEGSDLPPARSQRVLRALMGSITGAAESRGDMIDARRAMKAIKAGSNFDAYDFGC